MERYQRAFVNARALWDDLMFHVGNLACDSCDEAKTRVDFLVQLQGYQSYFETKMAGLEIMRRNTIEKLKTLERIPEGEYAGEAMDETAAFFEAYLNAAYSLLEIIAKFTPFFYRQSVSQTPITDYSFVKQATFFRNGGSRIDPEYSDYLSNKLWSWYKVLRDNRDAITHRAAVYIAFREDGSVRFLTPPKREEWLEGVFDWPTEPL